MNRLALSDPIGWLRSHLCHLAPGLTWALRHSRRVTPVSRVFGFDRGQPIDRHYIEQFLSEHRDDIRGRVLEIGGRTYTQRFGQNAVTRSDVLHALEDHSPATLVGDLASGKGIPRESFDCIILTQTLPFIYDVQSAVWHCHAALKPGGVVLATVPGISQISRYDMDRWGDYWRFTSLSIRRLFEAVFAAHAIQIQTYGNVYTATAFLRGLASREVPTRDLRVQDPDYQLLISVRAVRSEGAVRD